MVEDSRWASCQLPYRQIHHAAIRELQYLLERLKSCQSVRLHQHPRVSCPCCQQSSSSRELSLRCSKSILLLLRQTWPLPDEAVKAPEPALQLAVVGKGGVRSSVAGMVGVGAVNWCTLKMASNRRSAGMPRMWAAPAATVFVLFDTWRPCGLSLAWPWIARPDSGIEG